MHTLFAVKDVFLKDFGSMLLIGSYREIQNPDRTIRGLYLSVQTVQLRSVSSLLDGAIVFGT